MRVSVHNHHNARRLCEVEISAADGALLMTPPPLKDNWVALPDGRVVNMPRAEDHVVTIGDGPDLLRLFPATVNGIGMVMTNTPAAALARAIV